MIPGAPVPKRQTNWRFVHEFKEYKTLAACHAVGTRAGRRPGCNRLSSRRWWSDAAQPAFYYTDDVQYFPPGPEFKLSQEAAVMKAYNADQQAQSEELCASSTHVAQTAPLWGQSSDQRK